MMKALTLKQPWAGFVAAGIKTLENRNRPIAPKALFGQRFAIHAGLQTDELARITLDRTEPKPWPDLCKAGGCVVAVATLADALYIGGCSRMYIEGILAKREIPKQVRFCFGPTVYVLEDIVTLRSVVPARGFQGFWTLPGDVEAKVREQLAARAA